MQGARGGVGECDAQRAGGGVDGGGYGGSSIGQTDGFAEGVAQGGVAGVEFGGGQGDVGGELADYGGEDFLAGRQRCGVVERNRKRCRGWLQFVGEVGDLLADVESDANDDVVCIGGGGDAFKQNAADFACADEDVVWPFDHGADVGEQRIERLRHGKRRTKREGGFVFGSGNNQTKQQTAPRGRRPFAVELSATGGLLLGRD